MNQLMEISKAGKIELIGHEGMCLRPYLDSVKVWTIGGGHTASEDPDPKFMSKTAYQTVAWCFDLFSRDIIKYSDKVNQALKVAVTQYQFDALVSIAYNIGTGGMANSTFMKRINNNNSVGSLPFGFVDVPLELSLDDRTDRSITYVEEFVESFNSTSSIVDAIMMWCKPKEITNRRKKEAKLFSTGVYSNKGQALLFDTDGNGRTMYSKGKTINVGDYL